MPPRQSTFPSNSTNTQSQQPAAAPSSKTRQYAHLHSQLAQLNAHLADTENLMRITAAQAGDMRFLGGYVGGLFMAGSKVLGEEGGIGGASASGSGGGNGGKAKEEDEDDD